MKLETEETWQSILKLRKGFDLRFQSKLFPDLLYWNTTMKENEPSFPTLYWRKTDA